MKCFMHETHISTDRANQSRLGRWFGRFSFLFCFFIYFRWRRAKWSRTRYSHKYAPHTQRTHQNELGATDPPQTPMSTCTTISQKEEEGAPQKTQKPYRKTFRNDEQMSVWNVHYAYPLQAYVCNVYFVLFFLPLCFLLLIFILHLVVIFRC